MKTLLRVWFESLEHRRLLTGVTLITHGFNSNASGWVTQMGNQIAQMSGPLAQQPIYKMTVDDPANNGNVTVSSQSLGATVANASSREIVVLLDWSDVAGDLGGGGNLPTATVANAVATKLLGGFSIPDLATPLAQLPLHLIGHSRGASLVSELARGLGERGVWVDHVTYLDPHPVDGVNEPFGAGTNYGDAAMRVYANVQYADDFWRSDGLFNFDFDGEAVNGAYNLQLTESTLSGGSSTEHSDVHTWYHGTIGPPFSNSDGDVTSIPPGWYSTSTMPPMGPRDQVGWRASRIAKGARQAAGLKSAGAFRNAVTLSVSGANVWDDVQINGMLADQTISAGTSLAVTVPFEDRNPAAGGTRDATLTIGFDRDDNPFNGVFSSSSVLTSTLGSDTFSGSISTAGIAGGFRVYAKISNGTNTRYYYAPGRAIVTTPGYTNTWIGPEGGNWSTVSNWSSGALPTASDKVSIFDSDVTFDAAAATTKIAGLNLIGGATLNLGTKNLIIDSLNSPPLADVRTMLKSGQLFSSAAGTFDALGSGESSDVLELSGSQTATFAGVSVDATAILIRYTKRGDADLSGALDGDDYFRIDTGFPSQTAGFSHGDFDFNDHIDADDYFLLDANFARQTSPAPPAQAALAELPSSEFVTSNHTRPADDLATSVAPASVLT